jgi:hypothetical protein
VGELRLRDLGPAVVAHPVTPPPASFVQS